MKYSISRGSTLANSIITIEILNWSKYNPRKDVKKPTWFRFEHDFFHDWKFFGFTHEERCFWMYLLCQASAVDRHGFVTINVAHVQHVAGVSIECIRMALTKLKRNQVVKSQSVRIKHAHVSDPYATNERTNGRTTVRGKNKPLALSANADALTPQMLLKLWNENKGSLPRAEKLTPARSQKSGIRIKENGSQIYWLGIISRLAASPFCCGENDRGWRADFDFLLKPATHVKVSEGAYDNRERKEFKNTPAHETGQVATSTRANSASPAGLLRASARIYSLGPGCSAGSDAGAIQSTDDGDDRQLAEIQRANRRPSDG